MTTAPPAGPTVAILLWGDAVEDFLGPLGISVQAFATEMTGGWLFGYIEALRRAGVRSVVVCVSRAVRKPERHVHRSTGAVVHVLPLPRRYRLLRRILRDPYAAHTEGVGGARGLRWLRRAVRDVAPYLPVPVRGLCDVLRQERVDALVVQEYEAARFDVAVAVGAALGVPVFATFQGGTWHVSRVEALARPRSLQAAEGLVVSSSEEADRVRSRYGVPDHKLAPIFNPLDLEAWERPPRAAARQVLGVPAQAEVVAWHGRVDVHRKGLDVLLDAWALVVARRPGRDLRLRLIGTGPDAEGFHDRIRASRLPGIEWQDEYVLDRSVLHGHLAAADVYVLPSRHEGFPVALVEALASGLPAVAAAAPGVRDVLGDQPVGLVVPTGDAAALADGLGLLLDERDLRERMGSAARARAEAAFGLDLVGAALRAFLLPDTGGPSPRSTPPRAPTVGP